ncbi:hypothetical protein B0H14DRAFT_2590336 [Mycena olivaceomarginata]|nr:hypothetical protein B0H14DRAFT_2590336 [Mycena olivaceomarginata]
MWGAGEVVAGRDNNCASSDRGNLVETTESTRSLRMTMLGWKSGLVTDAALTRESRRSEGLVTGCGLLDGCDRRASERLDVFVERDDCGQKGEKVASVVEARVVGVGVGIGGGPDVGRDFDDGGSGRKVFVLTNTPKGRARLRLVVVARSPMVVEVAVAQRARWSESPAAVVVLVLLAVVVVAYGAVVLAVVACGRLRRMGLRRQGGGAVRGAEEEEGKDGCGGTRRRSERRDAAGKHAQTAEARRLSATSRAATERGWSTV